ncbi:MAG: hypothetical protein L6V93_16085 [Clostridiales bacterium]|nr:MAG: hypothetical protein L6V93_16085 [Clostridiales bacterium]
MDLETEKNSTIILTSVIFIPKEIRNFSTETEKNSLQGNLWSFCGISRA